MSAVIQPIYDPRRDAARELLIRRRARANVLDYANAIDVPGRPASENTDEAFFFPVETTMAHHHKLILESCEITSLTPYGRTMLLMPPGSAKSTYASVVFPSNYLGKISGRKIIGVSYASDLAKPIGRKIRQICRSNRYYNIFGTSLSFDSNAADMWELKNGSSYMGCGFMSGITGHRANGVIIDDPIKNREQADSKKIRDKIWAEYIESVVSRLIPGGWIILIQTRWHEDDLAGRILPDGWKGESGFIECKDGNIWNVICVQAKAVAGNNDPLGRRPGEYLWPEWFTQKHWEQFEIYPSTWASLFQQIPSPLEGGFFKPGNMPVLDAVPAGNIKWVRGWDLASVAGGGDWTVGLKLGRTSEGRLIIADVARGQWGPDERDEVLVNTAKMDGFPVRQSIPQDPGQAGKTQVLYLTRALAGYRVITSPESGDKITRAEPAAAQMNVGNIAMVRGEWNQRFIDELRAFPNGSNDDQVDALSRAFGELIGRGPLKITDELLNKFGA